MGEDTKRNKAYDCALPVILYDCCFSSKTVVKSTSSFSQDTESRGEFRGGRWSVSAVGSGFDAGHLISFTRADPDSPSTLLGKHLADDS